MGRVGCKSRLVKNGGKIVSTVGGAAVERLAERGVVATNVIGHSDPEAFAHIVQMAAEGKLSVRTRGHSPSTSCRRRPGRRRTLSR